MQINRLFEIVYLLMNKKHVTANELAAHFEVSKRTILRDIDALAMAGIPVYTTQGKGGGIFIQDSFLLNKAFFSEDEQKQILFSLQSMAATELIDTKQVLGRLRGLFNKPGREWIDVDFSRWGHSAEDNTKFELMKDAIIGERAISFDYVSPLGEQKGHVAFPLRLSFKSKSWYLQFFCPRENEYLVFKFNRISNMKILGESFCQNDYQPPEMKSVEDAPTEPLVEIKFAVSPYAKYRVYDEFAEGDITLNPDGTFTLLIPQGQWIYDYFLSYGMTAEVLEPQELREQMLAHLEKIRNKYQART
ncbi:MAG: YafY family transcriptional regulator [Defluviitaleaceae bacterium]|nr:YafY family transcriptional regulator [Defluviitaleaceae bacterium]